MRAKRSRSGLHHRPQLVQKIANGNPSAKVALDKRPSRARFEPLALCVILALVTFGVYFRTIGNPFVNFDDPTYVTENRSVQQGLSSMSVLWALTTTTAFNWHPLTWLSHELDCELFGLSPAGHHFSSLLLHVLNTVLLFLLLARATGAVGRSLLVAALFGLHPINVESVAWIAERKNVLCMFFFLLTVGAYGWYARKPDLVRYLAMTALFVLGLASKPMIVTLPFVLLLLDFWPLQRVQEWTPPSAALSAPQSGFWRLVLEKVPLLLVSAASCAVTLAVQQGAMGRVPPAVRFANSLYSYAMYLQKLVWPVSLAAFYPYKGYGLSAWQGLVCLFVLIAISVWVWRERSRWYLVVGWLWFLGTLVPMIGWVQVGDQSMADRYAYLPAIGVFVMLVWGAADLAPRMRVNSRIGIAAALALITVLSVLTWRQIGTWRSNYDLWSHAVDSTSDNFMAENFLGEAIMVKQFESTGQRYSQEAETHFRKAIRLNPGDLESRINLGVDLHEHGQLNDAIEQYLAVLRLTTDEYLTSRALIDLGAAYHQLGDYKKSREYYAQALQIDPGNQAIFVNLGRLSMDERIAQLAASASSRPSPQAYVELGNLQQAAGHLPEARESYRLALKLDPKMSDAIEALNQLGGGTGP